MPGARVVLVNGTRPTWSSLTRLRELAAHEALRATTRPRRTIVAAVLDASHTTDRLGELPARCAKPLRAALASIITVDDASPDAWARQAKAFDGALAAAGFPPDPDGANPTRAIPSASTLTPEQRVVAEILAYVEHEQLDRFALPATAWLRRQWLSLDPPGPLFSIELDNQCAFDALRTDDADAAQQQLASLPTAQRVALLADIMLAGPDFDLDFVEDTLRADAGALGADAGAWAATFADQLLALFAPGRSRGERGNYYAVPVVLQRVVFIALARARVPIEPRWDVLLPLEREVPLDEQKACIAAIPEARREAAMVAALHGAAFPDQMIEVAIALLATYPFEAVAREVAAQIDEARKPKQVQSQLMTLARLHPAIARALGGKGALPALPALAIVSIVAPVTLGALDATARKQLVATNTWWSNNTLAVEELFDELAGEPATERILPSLTAHARISRDGKPAYDAWLTMGDSGAVYAAGTTDIVAEIIQGDVECTDRALKMALTDTLRPVWSAVTRSRPPSKKPPAKKPPAKKPPAKKPPAKKPPARKPPAKKAARRGRQR